MGGDEGGDGLVGVVVLDKILVVCEAPTVLTRLLVSAERCVSACGGVDKYCRAS